MNNRQQAQVVLVVEDQPANMMLARATLERNGFAVIGASDAEEARKQLESTKPHLILMDIGLPGQDGLSLTRELKADALTADIPIVALTAHAMREDERQARDAGCDGYLSKPFSPRSLAGLVERLIASPGSDSTAETRAEMNSGRVSDRECRH